MDKKFVFKDKILPPSETSFGITFFIIFLVLSIYSFFYLNKIFFSIFLTVSLILLLFTIFFKNLLKPLNRIWFKFGLLLHKIVNPLIMGFVFFTIITITGVILRILGKRPLNLNKTNAQSYWISKTNNTNPDSIKNQF